MTNAVAKVGMDDVLLTYAHSSTIYSILLRAHRVSCLSPTSALSVFHHPDTTGREGTLYTQLARLMGRNTEAGVAWVDPSWLTHIIAGPPAMH